MTRGQLRHLERVNKELWILLSLFAIALLLNHVFASQQMVLGFYVLPTLGSAYLYGKRHATLTALASVLRLKAPTRNSIRKWSRRSRRQFRQGRLEAWAAPLTAA